MSVLPRIALFFMFSHGIHGIHRTFLLYILPQIALFFMFSHGIHGIHRTFLLLFSHGLYSSLCSPTEFTEYTEPSCCMFSHRFHRFTQMLLSRGCTCLKCTNPFCCCTSCSVGALETSAPPERTYLCRSVKSVGEYFQQPLP